MKPSVFDNNSQQGGLAVDVWRPAACVLPSSASAGFLPWNYALLRHSTTVKPVKPLQNNALATSSPPGPLSPVLYRNNSVKRHFCLSVVTNLLNLFVHVGTTGRYHNELLDSLTIILLYGSFLKIVINILFTHHCIHASCHVYLSHCYSLAWDRLSNLFFCLCMYVCMCLWARLRSHFSTDLHKIW